MAAGGLTTPNGSFFNPTNPTSGTGISPFKRCDFSVAIAKLQRKSKSEAYCIASVDRSGGNVLSFRDVETEHFGELGDRHRSDIPAAAGANRDRSGLLFFFANDKDVG